MITLLDLKAELARLTMLKGRSPATTDAEKRGAIARLAPYRDGAIFASKFSGASDWERHPRGDEIVQVVEAPDGVCLMTATPQPRDHVGIAVEDPRTVD